MNWYYAEKNERFGPMPEEEIARLAREGKITPDMLVWSEGMAEWQPFKEVFPQETGDTQLESVPSMAEGPPPLRDGPPWERRATMPFFQAIVGTLKGVLFDPVPTFERMKREGGLAEPMFFMLLVGGVCSYVSCIYNVIYRLSGGSDATMRQYQEFLRMMNVHPSGMDNAAITAALHFTPGMAVMALATSLFLVPLILLVSSFLQAGLIHLCLLFLGGAKQPFETTYRVVCYTAGSTGVFQLLPMCGAWICVFWSIVANCIGIAKAHEIPTGKAVAAVLMPLIACCGFLILFFGLAVGLVVAAANHH